jgi:hypothetical protein
MWSTEELQQVLDELAVNEDPLSAAESVAATLRLPLEVRTHTRDLTIFASFSTTAPFLELDGWWRTLARAFPNATISPARETLRDSGIRFGLPYTCCPLFNQLLFS